MAAQENYNTWCKDWLVASLASETDSLIAKTPNYNLSIYACSEPVEKEQPNLWLLTFVFGSIIEIKAYDSLFIIYSLHE